MNYALLAHPLPRDYRLRLECALGYVPEYLTVAELRRLSLRHLVQRLRRLNARTLVIPMQDVNTRTLLPVLYGLAAISTARRIELVHPDLSRHALPRLKGVGLIVRAGVASLDGAAALLACRRELGKLQTLQRQEVTLGRGDVMYLRPNLSFGVTVGGSVGHVAGVVNALVRRGQPLLFLGAEAPVMVDKAVDYRRINPPSAYGIPGELNLYRFHRRCHREAGEIARTRDISLVYQRLTVGNYSGVTLARRLRVPLVVEYNGSEVWAQEHWGRPLRYREVALKAEEVSLAHAHTVVTVSTVLRDELVERGVAPERVATYPNCIDPKLFDPLRFSQIERDELRERYGISPKACVVTFVGTFGQWHGVDILAAAIKRLVDGEQAILDGRNVHFMLVGDGHKFRDVQCLLSSPPYSGYVTLTGLVAQQEAPLHLAASDVLVSPHVQNPDGSRFFGSPTKLFEYMAMGKPILASELDQIAEVFHGSPNVFELGRGGRPEPQAMAVLVEPGSVDELVTGIRLLVTHPEWHAPLGRAARAEALSRYTWDLHVDEILRTVRASVDRA